MRCSNPEQNQKERAWREAEAKLKEAEAENKELKGEIKEVAAGQICNYCFNRIDQGEDEPSYEDLKARLSQAEAEKDDAERRWSEIADSLQKKISVYEAQEKAWLSRIVVGDMDACGALIDALKIQGTKLKEAEAEIRRIKNG